MNYMNIIRARQEERRTKIGIIKSSILKAQEPDLKKLVFICCKKWGMSERVVKEYIKQAQFEIEMESTIPQIDAEKEADEVLNA